MFLSPASLNMAYNLHVFQQVRERFLTQFQTEVISEGKKKEVQKLALLQTATLKALILHGAFIWKNYSSDEGADYVLEMKYHL